jgi:chaperonin GroES
MAVSWRPSWHSQQSSANVGLALSPGVCQRPRWHRDDIPTARNRTSHTRERGLDVATTIKPLEDRILVQPLEAEQTTASGLVIPDTAKEKPQEGKVIATGPGRVDDNGNRVPLDVAEGDVVIFSKYGGTEVKYDGKELLLLNARDILAVVQK